MSSPSAPKAISDQAFVLHSVPYKETSLIIELFTRESGRVPVIAKGAKRKSSALRSVLVNFQPLNVRYSGKSEVKTLQAAEWRGGYLPPEGKALFASFYLNELLMTGLRRDDPHPELFQLYEATLSQLSGGQDLQVIIRRFEIELLAELGYGIDFSADSSGDPLVDSCEYFWQDEQGWVPFSGNSQQGKIVFAGQLLSRIGQGELDLPLAQALKGFTRHMLNQHVAPNGLLSRTWMEQLIRYD